MLEMLPGAPDGVLAFKAVGEVTADDYRKVLDPAVHDTIAKHGGVRFVYVLGPEWTGYSAGAIWEDKRIGLAEWAKWERCAVVSDRDWIEHLTKAFAWLVPGKVKVFELDGLDDAMAWAAASD